MGVAALRFDKGEFRCLLISGERFLSHRTLPVQAESLPLHDLPQIFQNPLGVALDQLIEQP